MSDHNGDRWIVSRLPKRPNTNTITFTPDDLDKYVERRIAEAVAAEREACAKRCVEIIIARFYHKFLPDTDVDFAWRDCVSKVEEEMIAAAIRARGESDVSK